MKKSGYSIIILIIILVAVIIWNNAHSQNEVVIENTIPEQAQAIQATTTDKIVAAPVAPAPSAQIEIIETPTYVPTISQSTVTVHLNETKVIHGISIMPKNIYYNDDNVRVSLAVKGPMTTKNVSLTAQQAFLIDNAKVTLESVRPTKEPRQELSPEKYTFVVKVESIQ